MGGKCCDIVVIECNLVFMSWGLKMVQLDLYPLYGVILVV